MDGNFGPEEQIRAEINRRIAELDYASSKKKDPNYKEAIEQTVRYWGRWLFDPRINEICYNGNGEICCEDYKGDKIYEKVDFVENDLIAFGAAIAARNEIGDGFGAKNPIVSAVLPGGERIQMVTTPVCKEGMTGFTIRKPSLIRYKMEDYINAGIIDERLSDMLRNMIADKKNIVICGETGSGKTTFMKTLIDFIPEDDRCITIEDVAEITFYNQLDKYQLYYPAGSKPSDKVSAAALIRSTMRMTPKRILLAEVRGSETYDFLNIVSSGHDGAMTSCHAGSVSSCIDRMIMMAMQNEEARSIGVDVVKDMIRKNIHAIVVLRRVDKRRTVTEYMVDEVLYKNVGNCKFERLDGSPYER